MIFLKTFFSPEYQFRRTTFINNTDDLKHFKTGFILIKMCQILYFWLKKSCKSFEYAHGDIKIYQILPDALWNSTTVTMLNCICSQTQKRWIPGAPPPAMRCLFLTRQRITQRASCRDLWASSNMSLFEPLIKTLTVFPGFAIPVIFTTFELPAGTSSTNWASANLSAVKWSKLAMGAHPRKKVRLGSFKTIHIKIR